MMSEEKTLITREFELNYLTSERDMSRKFHTDILTEDEFRKLHDGIKLVLRGKELGLANYIIIIQTTMEFVEEFKNLKGHQKLALVLDLFARIVSEDVKDSTEKRILLALLDSTIPQTIEVIIRASKQLLQLHNVAVAAQLCGCVLF